MGDFPNKDTQFKPGQSGNPAGKPKGTKHIATWIQEMLNDEEFETAMLDTKKGYAEFRGAPIKAIIQVAIHKAIHDKEKGQQWAEWLAKHGYGTKQIVELSDPRKEILDQYLGVSDAGETEKATG